MVVIRKPAALFTLSGRPILATRGFGVVAICVGGRVFLEIWNCCRYINRAGRRRVELNGRHSEELPRALLLSVPAETRTLRQGRV